MEIVPAIASLPRLLAVPKILDAGCDSGVDALIEDVILVGVDREPMTFAGLADGVGDGAENQRNFGGVQAGALLLFSQSRGGFALARQRRVGSGKAIVVTQRLYDLVEENRDVVLERAVRDDAFAQAFAAHLQNFVAVADMNSCSNTEHAPPQTGSRQSDWPCWQ